MNMALRLTLIALLTVGSTCLVSSADDKPRAEPEPNLRPAAPQPVPAADLEAALQRGVNYLVEHQNKDGSWGSPALKGGVPIIVQDYLAGSGVPVDVEVFYDGDCPLCTREIRLLRRLDRRGRIRFTA